MTAPEWFFCLQDPAPDSSVLTTALDMGKFLNFLIGNNGTVNGICRQGKRRGELDLFWFFCYLRYLKSSHTPKHHTSAHTTPSPSRSTHTTYIFHKHTRARTHTRHHRSGGTERRGPGGNEKAPLCKL